ncbi:glutathione S-transferase family protein [Stenotrophomonas sp. SORGH_AS_0282]|jgi:glutathione S-transferase|uniref:glutathione S-transferase family protein n=1 Tax=Stenotrophomonas sp. SORGH_AS_0282 TaxID=3041763 RepID=UPI00277E195B|nr:glutathione S-transferase family protein [Stenotrophomonas sp. SORGH_AS_0282]MDQ1063110.1 glutathione S-transferase [Stenotrophomonas sp. SORGH_AS_0282]MDQ1188532.1 glutathione S-transferase [Stenotrophomonas sp. SORGH_AS_0282]
MLKLHIGNKNYSSWSMRPWVLMTQAGIPFDEVVLRFDGFDPDSQFKRSAEALSPSGTVPVLVDGALVVWDSLAIAEYLAERFPESALWPQETSERALARSATAAMHSGFGALRSHLPMNIEALLPEVGARVLREQPDVVADLQRLQALWERLLARHEGPLLFDRFSIADAFFAPVVMRLHTYAVPVSPRVAAYMQQVRALPGVQAWIAAALDEHDFRPFEEPYRQAPDPG